MDTVDRSRFVLAFRRAFESLQFHLKPSSAGFAAMISMLVLASSCQKTATSEESAATDSESTANETASSGSQDVEAAGLSLTQPGEPVTQDDIEAEAQAAKPRQTALVLGFVDPSISGDSYGEMILGATAWMPSKAGIDRPMGSSLISQQLLDGDEFEMELAFDKPHLFRTGGSLSESGGVTAVLPRLERLAVGQKRGSEEPVMALVLDVPMAAAAQLILGLEQFVAARELIAAGTLDMFSLYRLGALLTEAGLWPPPDADEEHAAFFAALMSHLVDASVQTARAFAEAEIGEATVRSLYNEALRSAFAPGRIAQQFADGTYHLGESAGLGQIRLEKAVRKMGAPLSSVALDTTARALRQLLRKRPSDERVVVLVKTFLIDRQRSEIRAQIHADLDDDSRQELGVRMASVARDVEGMGLAQLSGALER